MKRCPLYAVSGLSGHLRRRVKTPAAFTLIELILAMGIMAIVMLAINGVFFSAMRLRESTANLVEDSIPVQRTLAVIRQDLQGAVPPDGTLSGDFKVGAVTSLGLSLPADIELFTTTASLRENEPWGEIQKVTYALRVSTDRSRPGKDLIRSVTRNLLAAIIPQPEDQWMMGGINSIEFDCYDGAQWRNFWDTTLTDTNLPFAVRVKLQRASDDGGDADSALEMVVPIDALSRTNLTSAGAAGNG